MQRELLASSMNITWDPRRWWLSVWYWKASKELRSILRTLRRWASTSRREDANSTKRKELIETDSVPLNSYLDEHFLSPGEPGSPSLVGRRIAKPYCWLQRSDGP